MVLSLIIGATVAVSLISLLGILLLKLRLTDFSGEGVTSSFVSFSAGAMLAAAFFDLLPGALEKSGASTVALFALAGLLSFFALEKGIHWHHHHTDSECPGRKKVKALGFMVVFGDGLHNFFDGVAIAASFMASVPVGIATAIAVTLHEIPHELGDFSLLLYSGFSTRDAALFNLLSALVAVLGGVSFYFLSPYVSNLVAYGLSFALGNFLYIATVDLVPELHKETDPAKSAWQFALLVLGIAVVVGLQRLVGAA